MDLAQYPTAVHATADTHDTAVSAPRPPASGVGVVCTVHVLPSHTAAIGPSAFEPTATHMVVEGHDTPSSRRSGPVAAACTTQAVPFQRSMSPPRPTATQSAGAGHDTLVSCPSSRGDLCTTQLRPSQRSAMAKAPTR